MVMVVRPPGIRRVSRLRPSSGRPPSAADRTVAWPRAAGGRRGGGGAGVPGGAPLLPALSGSAPPSRAGTARSDVSAAPPRPPLASLGPVRNREAEAGDEGRPALRPGPACPRPACVRTALPANAPLHWVHPEPPTTWEVVTSRGLEASQAAPSPGIQDARGRMESLGFEGRLRSGCNGGI